jgi:Cu+-exporting ATPase
LTSGRESLQSEVATRLEERLNLLGPNGLGIRLKGSAYGVSVHDLHPPQEVVPAYYDVIKAIQDRDRLVNEAESQAKRTYSEAEAKARQTQMRAEAGKVEKVLQAQADHDRFLARQQARTPPEMGTVPLKSRGLSPFPARSREPQTVQAMVTDFRLFWEGLTRAVKDRDLVIVDADKVPGRRNLFLLDLNRLPVPLPAAVAPVQKPRLTPTPPRGTAEPGHEDH